MSPAIGMCSTETFGQRSRPVSRRPSEQLPVETLFACEQDQRLLVLLQQAIEGLRDLVAGARAPV